jgi:hypothetical protein
MDTGEAALVGAAGLIVAALVPSVISLLNRGKLNAIHVLVNSHLTEVQDRLDSATVKIDSQDAQMKEAIHKIEGLERALTQSIPSRGVPKSDDP